MSTLNPREINLILAKALGLPVENLLNFSITCRAGIFPVVQVEYLVLDDKGIKTVTETYRVRLEAKEAA